MVVHMPTVSPYGVVWIQSFPLLIGHLPMTGRALRLVAAMSGSLVRGCLLVIRSKPIHLHTHLHIHAYTYTYTI